METIRDAWRAPDLPEETIATIGNFDGLHLGQRETVGLAVARAREVGLTSVAVTFDPHPLRVLRPEKAPPLLTTQTQRERLFASCEVDYLLVVNFTPTFAQTPARRFVRDFLVDRLKIRELYVGSRFVFGKDREGDLSLLRSMGESFGFRAFGVQEVVSATEAAPQAGRPGPISSTRIRAAVEGGEVERAEQWLTRPYAIEGIVIRGSGRGHEFGFPTLNVATENELLPKNGVYVTEVSVGLDDPRRFDAVTNVGTRPTVDESEERVVEAHLLDRDLDLYGERVSVSFLKRLRDERAFPSVDALTAQIAEDAAAAREFFSTERRSVLRKKENTT